jgi:hypothetical protein
MGQRHHLLVMRILIVADWLDTIIARVERYDILDSEFTARLIARPLNHSMIDERDITLARVQGRVLQGPPNEGRGNREAASFGIALLERLGKPAPERLWRSIAWIWPMGQPVENAIEVPPPTAYEQAQGDPETMAAIDRGDITVNPDGSLTVPIPET